MKLLQRILIGLGAAGFILAALTVLLFNRTAFGWQALSVPTGSMSPAMSPGSLVITHQVPIASLKPGDIITHTNPTNMRTTLTHRILKVYKIDGRILAFITKGDANPSPDRPVVGGLVQGKAVIHLPYVGEALLWAKTWTGIAILVYLPAFIIMVEETRRMAVYLRQGQPYRLEGWVVPRPRERKPQLKPAIAISVALSLAVVGVGWQVANALATSPGSANGTTLLVLSQNVIAAKQSRALVKPSQASTPAPSPSSECKAVKTICYNRGQWTTRQLKNTY